MYTEEKRKEIIELYCSEMEIIKLRTNQVLGATKKIGFLQSAVEYKALQLRKIIEQVILASLVANAEEYKNYYKRLDKDWNVRLISQDLYRINNDFFPQKVIDDHANHKIDNDPSGLICKELINTHAKLGKYLHAHNPFSQEWDYNKMNAYLDEECVKIAQHLNTHIIRPYGADAFIFVVMKSDVDGHVHANWFERV